MKAQGDNRSPKELTARGGARAALSSTVQGPSVTVVPMVPHPTFCPCPWDRQSPLLREAAGNRAGLWTSHQPCSQTRREAVCTSGTPGGCELCCGEAVCRGEGEMSRALCDALLHPCPVAAGDKNTSTCSWFLKEASEEEDAAGGEVKLRRLQVPEKTLLDRSTRRQQPPGHRSLRSKAQSSRRAPWRAGSEV